MNYNDLLECILFTSGDSDESITTFINTTTSAQLGTVFREFMSDIFNAKYRHTINPSMYSHGIKMLVAEAVAEGKSDLYLSELDAFCTKSYGATKDDDLSLQLLIEMHDLVTDNNSDFEKFEQLKLLLAIQENLTAPILEERLCFELSNKIDVLLAESLEPIEQQGLNPVETEPTPSNSI